MDLFIGGSQIKILFKIYLTMKFNKTKKDNEMTRIARSLENSGLNYKEDKKDNIEEGQVEKEKERIKDLALDDKNKTIKENSGYKGPSSYMGGEHGVGRGKTVNSMIDDFYFSDEKVNPKKAKPIQPEEALEISIKRTLRSGAPVNDMSFYDEVNWNLMNLGFAAKSPIEIKNTMDELLKY